MESEMQPKGEQWDEANSLQFINYGHYFVPKRDLQIDIICRLIPAQSGTSTILELGGGEGLLAVALLDRYPACVVHGLDGSAEMRERSARRLAAFGARYTVEPFDLGSEAWRKGEAQYRGIVSSLCIHHLDDRQKQALYRDLWPMLEPEGAIVIADIVEPTSKEGRILAAQQWDDEVRRRTMDTGDANAWQTFQQDRWNYFRYPDGIDHPSALRHHLTWLEDAGFVQADVYWLYAGHAIYGARKG